MSYELQVLCNERAVAVVVYDPAEDRFDLDYAAAWAGDQAGFPLSPALPLVKPPGGYPPGTVRRFLENLLPEGRALDVAASTYQISKNNLFALIRALGAETAGALSFRLTEREAPALAVMPKRLVSLPELRGRIVERNLIPFIVWDERVRLSIPGYQDKLPVYLDAEGRMFLVEPPLASTHIVKPEPLEAHLPHLVANEHYCMTLAARLRLPVAPVRILRLPEPLLVVARFDRRVVDNAVVKRHIIDGCQATDLPVSAKYERNFGTGRDVRHIRDGVSFQRLFAACQAFAANKAASKLALLRWALFQFVIGNSDAHGKNFSFFVGPGGIDAAPWYDLVSVIQYERLAHELAMAFGDEFGLQQVSAHAFADFAKRCSIPRPLLAREMRRMAKLLVTQAAEQAKDEVYAEAERVLIQRIAEFCMQQARRLQELAPLALGVRDDTL